MNLEKLAKIVEQYCGDLIAFSCPDKLAVLSSSIFFMTI